MTIAITIVLFLSLIFVAYEDFKYRGVQWWVFPIVLSLNLIMTRWINSDWGFLEQSLISILLLISLLTLTAAVFYILKRQQLWKALGLGDILFFIAILPLFSTWGFLFFLTTTFIITAILHVLLQFIKPTQTIPLAGYQSVLLMLLFGIKSLNLIGFTEYGLGNNFLL